MAASKQMHAITGWSLKDPHTPGSLMIPQLMAEQFWSLSASPLWLAEQVCVIVCFIYGFACCTLFPELQRSLTYVVGEPWPAAKPPASCSLSSLPQGWATESGGQKREVNMGVVIMAV